MSVPSPRQLLDLTDRVVVVTGAGRGIGAGIALRFAEAGASVVANYRESRSAAEEVVARIRSMGRDAAALQADVTKRPEVERLLEQVVETFDRIDILINNAGVYPMASLLDMPEESWDLVVDANLRGTHLCTQAAARRMVAAGAGGAIVNIASIEAENPAPMHSHYNAAKAGVVMYTRAAAQELGPSGIRVNAVSPGLIWRDGLEGEWPDGVSRYRSTAPLGRLGLADDVADACLFLSSPAARWITGVNLVVDGGVMTHTVY